MATRVLVLCVIVDKRARVRKNFRPSRTFLSPLSRLLTPQYVDPKATPRDNPAWFPNAKLNWAENQLRNAATHPDDIAIIDTIEPCPGYAPGPRRVTQKELYNMVAKTQTAMKAAGLKAGHRVAYWGGNRLVGFVVKDIS